MAVGVAAGRTGAARGVTATRASTSERERCESAVWWNRRAIGRRRVVVRAIGWDREAAENAEKAAAAEARRRTNNARAAPPAMIPAAFDDDLMISFDDDEEDVGEDDKEMEERALIEATVARLRSRQALGKTLMTEKPKAPVAMTAGAKAARKLGRNTVKKSDWQSFVDWKTLEHQEFETLSD